jgi:hypothetical protein
LADAGVGRAIIKIMAITVNNAAQRYVDATDRINAGIEGAGIPIIRAANG